MHLTEGQVKERLEAYKDARARFDSARLKLQETEALLTSISIDYTRERVKSSPHTLDKIGELVDELARLRKECLDEAWEAMRTMDEVTAFIKRLNDGQLESILVKKYILGETMQKIADDLGFVERHIYRLHDEAIARLR